MEIVIGLFLLAYFGFIAYRIFYPDDCNCRSLGMAYYWCPKHRPTNANIHGLT